MRIQIKTIEVSGEQYPLAFTFGVVAELQEVFGTVTKWENAFLNFSGEEFPLTVLQKTFRVMSNEGIDITNEKATKRLPFITDRQAGRILSMADPDGLNMVINSIREMAAEYYGPPDEEAQQSEKDGENPQEPGTEPG